MTQNRTGTPFSYVMPDDVKKILENLPNKTEAITEAIRAQYGKGTQQAHAIIRAALLQVAIDEDK